MLADRNIRLVATGKWCARLKSVFTGEYEVFLQNLQSARQAAKITQRELALRLGKPQSFVSKYERGERRLDVVEFVTIAKAIGIDPCRIVRKIETRMMEHRGSSQGDE
ncbi:MAG: helix-turn-helix domain-containing protein [Chloroflexota bacterium]